MYRFINIINNFKIVNKNKLLSIQQERYCYAVLFSFSFVFFIAWPFYIFVILTRRRLLLLHNQSYLFLNHFFYFYIVLWN